MGMLRNIGSRIRSGTLRARFAATGGEGFKGLRKLGRAAGGAGFRHLGRHKGKYAVGAAAALGAGYGLRKYLKHRKKHHKKAA